jgi:outer membrane protein assembly factor BamB
LLIDHEGPSYLLGVDKKTGDTVWMTERDSRVSYSSPAIVHVRNRPQIVCSSSGSIEGYDPETGERLWKLADDVGGNRAATPLACGDGRFVMAASPGMHNENDAEARKTNGVVTVEQTDSGYVAKVLWRTEKAMPAFNTPTVAEGLAYWVNRVGVLFCFDAESGEEVYSVRLRQGCWSTPVVVGDRLYVFGKDGLTSVVRMGREFELLAENQLWDPHEAGEESEFRRRASGRDAGGGRRTEHAREHAAAPAQVQEVTTVPNSHLDSDPADAGGPAARRGDETRRPEEPARRTPEEEERVRQQGENRFASPVQYGVALVNGSIVIRSGEKVYCLAQQSTQP